MDTPDRIDWSQARWLNPPLRSHVDGGDLLITTDDRTDFWRVTGYGFTHHNGHALLTPLPEGTAVEVDFDADFSELYDQAGAMVYTDEFTWLKAGIEYTDDAPHLGAVVTRGMSDWSMAPVPEWRGHRITVRVSRRSDAVTVRARRAGESWRMVRLAPLDPTAPAAAGPFCCSPLRAGLQVRFTGFRLTSADTGIHDDPAG
ncbi:hypothetical protein LX16_1451 [Stackebrandtia albiflava]|uniref:DUF1349 domain-containing protein n=1 Tax=Stackebrandtia albiflava TaxID=406432 RepID=A0A562VD30_9ACTN|nr:DUF1349 domain-containing protein [Stackebrandtia albiflava]TWJ15737.1 hypothetical protein LX16_1451 [Stackebrandtia albiflava]